MLLINNGCLDFFLDFQHAARHADTPKECVRLLGLAFLQQGHSVNETAQWLSVHVEAVHKWLARYKKGGLEAMADQPGHGRKPFLADELKEDFKESVLALQEQKSGGSISGKDIKEMLSEKFHVTCSLSTVYNLLHEMVLSWISGRTRHPKQDLEVQDEFKKNL